MHEVTKLEGLSSPHAEQVTHTRCATDGTMRMQSDGCRDEVIFTNADTTTVLRT
ncbi:hypothetical protein CO731_00515 [Aminobacter sp. MSH1]|nr:hypothetical protein CO731_00515 [Aminobacter sp. MSH1]